MKNYNFDMLCQTDVFFLFYSSRRNDQFIFLLKNEIRNELNT